MRTHTTFSSLCRTVQFSATGGTPRFLRSRGSRGQKVARGGEVAWVRVAWGGRKGCQELGGKGVPLLVREEWLLGTVASAQLRPRRSLSGLGQCTRKGLGRAGASHPVYKSSGRLGTGAGRAGQVAAAGRLSSGAPREPRRPLPRRCRLSTATGYLSAAA